MSFRKRYVLITSFVGIIAVGVVASCKTRSRSRMKGSDDQFSGLSGGVCSTSGKFTREALQNAKLVRDRIEAFMNNEACSAVTKAVADLPSAQSGGGQEDENAGMSLFGMSQEVQALRRIHSNGAAYADLGVTPDQVQGLLNQRLFQMIGVEQSPINDGTDDSQTGMQRVRNDVALALNQKRRILRSAGTAVDAIGAMFEGLTASTACPINQPNIVGPVIMASVKILGSYAGADPGLAAKVSGSLQKFITYSQTEYFRNALAQMDQAELGLTISCLIETTTNGFCAVRDNNALLQDAMRSEITTVQDMRGYVLFARELPVLTKWLVLLKSSQPTRIRGIVQNQIANMQTPVIIQQKRFEIASRIEDVRFNLVADPQAARASIYGLAQEISHLLAGPVADNIPPFFDMRYNPRFRVFTLLGVAPPPDVTRSVTPLSQEQYFENNNFAPVGEPVAALATIQSKVSEMFATISGQVSTFLGRNSNQDVPGVIGQFEQKPSQTLPSPRKVFVDMQNYMLDVLDGINQDAANDPSVAQSARPMKVLLVDTIKKIDRILEASDKMRAPDPDLDRQADELLNRPRRLDLALSGDENPVSDADRRMSSMTNPLGGAGSSIAEASASYDAEEQSNAQAIEQVDAVAKAFANFRQFGAIVVTELDMDTQLEMMIVNRLARVLQYDMQRMMRRPLGRGQSLSPVTKALLMISSDLMENRFTSVFSDDPQRMRIDLASAQTINMTTLEAIGSSPSGRFNPYGSTNPITNAFMRGIGVLAARTAGGATTSQDVSNYIVNTLNAGSPSDAAMKEFGETAKAYLDRGFPGLLDRLNLNPLRHIKNTERQQGAVNRMAGSDAILSGANASTPTMAFARWMRPDLYWVPNYWSGQRIFSDTPEGAMATLRAVYCMQTLALPDPRPFQPLCRGAVLYSIFESADTVEKRRGHSVSMQPDGRVQLSGLSLIYDDWFYAYEKNEQMRKSATRSNFSSAFQTQRICAYHDHLRANEIYSLTRPLRDAEVLGRGSAK